MRRLPLLFLLLIAACDGGDPEVAATESAIVDPTQPPAIPKPWAFNANPVLTSSAPLAAYLPGSSEVTPTGAYTYEIPLEVPPGRAGMAPTLALGYSSASTVNGSLGIGWSLRGLSSITRCGAGLGLEGYVDGVDYTSFATDAAADRFCLDGNKLVLVAGTHGAQGSEYRTELDTFAKITATAVDEWGPTAFEVRSKDGRIRTYTALARERFHVGPAGGPTSDGELRAQWVMTSDRDRAGNAIQYAYALKPATIAGVGLVTQVVIDEIRYTAHPELPAQRTIKFTYKERPDRSFAWSDGVPSGLHLLVDTIVMSAPNPTTVTPVWMYRFGYAQSTSSHASLLASVQRCGATAEGAPVACSWKKQLAWTQAPAAPAFTTIDRGVFPLTWAVPGFRLQDTQVLDVNGDGSDDLLLAQHDPYAPVVGDEDGVVTEARLYWGGRTNPLAGSHDVLASGGAYPLTTRLRDSRPLDIDGDGKVDLWTMYVTGENGPIADSCAAKVIHWSASLGRFIDGNASIPAHTCGESRHLFLDWDGDRRLDRLSATDHWEANGLDDETLVRGSWRLALNEGGSFGTETPIGLVSGCRARVTDVDGDGRGELLSAKASANGTACGVPVVVRGTDQTLKAQQSSILPDEFLGTDYHLDPRSQLGDFNGDGLEDALLVPQPGMDGGLLAATIRWNTGAGYVAEKPAVGLEIADGAGSTPGAPYHRDDGGIQIADFNRDGRADVLVWTYMPQGNGVYIDGYPGHMLQARIGLSNGDGSFTMVTPQLPYGTFNYDFDLVRTGDFNGDGATDIAMVEERPANAQFPEGEHHLVLALAQPAIIDRLQAVRDEHAGWDREYVAYSTEASPKPEAPAATCAYPLTCTGRGGAVLVRSVTRRDHLVDPVDPAQLGHTLHYSYEDPVVDGRARRFLGFRKFRIWDPTRPAETILVFDPRKAITAPGLPDARRYPSAQRPVSVTTVTPIVKANELLRTGTYPARVTRTTHTNGVRFGNGGTTAFFVTTASSDLTWEQPVTVDLSPSVAEHITGVVQPAAPPIRVDTTSNVDAYGNPTWINRQTVGGVKSSQTFAYEHRTDDWLIGLLRQHVETRSEADGAPAAVKRTLDVGYDALGRVAWTSRELNAADPTTRTTTTVERDAFGNVITSTQSGGVKGGADELRVGYYAYAPTFPGQPDERMFVSQVWAPAEVAAYRPSAWFATQPAYGVRFAEQNVNGVRRFHALDALGRIVESLADGRPAETITYAPRIDAYAASVSGLEVTRTEGGRSATEVTDMAGRVLRTAASGFGGAPVSVARRYDALGRLVSVSRPFTFTPTVFTQYAYDSLDRVYEELTPNGGTLRREHALFETHTFDPSNYETVAVVDVDGRLIRSSNIVDGASLDTTYSYAPFDLVEDVTDDAGNVVHHQYDVRGRVVRRDDPDRGTHTALYDGLGQLREQRHLGTNKLTTYGYDGAGRRTAVVNSDGVTRFYYDTQPNGIGQLARAESPDGVVSEYTYDGAGRAIIEQHTIDGVTYQVKQPYDAEGRPLYIDYPAVGASPLRVTPSYNGSDDITALAFQVGLSTSTLITYQARTVDGALGNAALGNGLQLRYAYYANTGWPKRFEARNTAAAQTVFDLSYAYQANGLVQSRTDAIAGRSERFAYDAAYRLTSWITSAPNVNRFVDYRYDAIGNLEKTLLNNVVVEASTFGKPDGSAPHAIATRTVGATVEQYGHDLEGRQTSGPGRTIQFRANDLPRAITKNGQTWQFKYDAFGRRVVKTGPDGTTVYVGDVYERRTHDGVTKHVYLVHGPDGVVAQLVRTGNTSPVVQYLLADALGSTSKVASATGAIVETAYYEPFGLRIHANNTPYVGTSDVREGFTGHESDATLGLINMRGRMYDPTAKRFLSADPFVTVPTFGQAWNPYSYVVNSPLNLTDPTGYRFDGQWSCLNSPGGCLEGTFGQTGGGGTGGGTGGGVSTPTSEGSQHAMDSFMEGSEARSRGLEIDRSDGGGGGGGGRVADAPPVNGQAADDDEIPELGPGDPWFREAIATGARFKLRAGSEMDLARLNALLALFAQHTHVIAGDPFVLPGGRSGIDNGPTLPPLHEAPFGGSQPDLDSVVRDLQDHVHMQHGSRTLTTHTERPFNFVHRDEDGHVDWIDLPLLADWIRSHTHFTSHGGVTSPTPIYVPGNGLSVDELHP